MPLFNAEYLRNATRYRQLQFQWNSRIGTYTQVHDLLEDFE